MFGDDAIASSSMIIRIVHLAQVTTLKDSSYWLKGTRLTMLSDYYINQTKKTNANVARTSLAEIGLPSSYLEQVSRQDVGGHESRTAA